MTKKLTNLLKTKPGKGFKLTKGARKALEEIISWVGSDEVAHVRVSLRRDGSVGFYANKFESGKRRTVNNIVIGWNRALLVSAAINKLVAENESSFGFFGEEWEGKPYLLFVAKTAVDDDDDDDVSVIIDDDENDDDVVDGVIIDNEEAKPETKSEAAKLLDSIGL